MTGVTIRCRDNIKAVCLLLLLPLALYLAVFFAISVFDGLPITFTRLGLVCIAGVMAFLFWLAALGLFSLMCHFLLEKFGGSQRYGQVFQGVAWSAMLIIPWASIASLSLAGFYLGDSLSSMTVADFVMQTAAIFTGTLPFAYLYSTYLAANVLGGVSRLSAWLGLAALILAELMVSLAAIPLVFFAFHLLFALRSISPTVCILLGLGWLVLFARSKVRSERVSRAYQGADAGEYMDARSGDK